MWVLLVNAGVPQGLEDIARRLALLDQDASLVGNIEPLFAGLVSLAAVYMLTQTAIATVGAFFYNLVSDLVGGIEVVVLEEPHLDAPEKAKKVKNAPSNESKETVMMSFVNSIKKSLPFLFMKLSGSSLLGKNKNEICFSGFSSFIKFSAALTAAL